MTRMDIIVILICVLSIGLVLKYDHLLESKKVTTARVPVHRHHVTIECEPTGEQPALYTHFLSPFPMRF